MRLLRVPIREWFCEPVGDTKERIWVQGRAEMGGRRDLVAPWVFIKVCIVQKMGVRSQEKHLQAGCSRILEP